MKASIVGLLAVLVLCDAPGVRADTIGVNAPILVNGGFETGDFSGWTLSIPSAPPNSFGVAPSGTLIPGTFPRFGPTDVTVRTGQFAAYAATASFLQQGLLLEQTVTLVPGLHEAGFYLGVDSPQGPQAYGASAKIFVNGVSQPLTVVECIPAGCSSNGIIPGDGSFTEFSTFIHAEGGPTTFGFLLSGSGDGAAGISMDDAFVNLVSPTPEPASLLLVGTGVVGLLWRRRRADCSR